MKSPIPEKVEVGAIQIVQQNPLWPKPKQSRGWKSVHVCPSYGDDDEKEDDDNDKDDNDDDKDNDKDDRDGDDDHFSQNLRRTLQPSKNSVPGPMRHS